MIRILFRHGLSCPFVFCDVCGDAISDPLEGAAVFDMTAKSDKTDVLHAHKGKCHDEAEKRIGEKVSGWQELSAHIYFLCTNLDITPARLEEFGKIHKWPE